jgi:hypothetical protein
VRLIVVAEVARDVREMRLRLLAQGFHRPVESDDAREGLRRHTDLLAESGNQMLLAPADLFCEGANPGTAARAQQGRPCPRHGLRWRVRGGDARRNRAIEDIEARLPRGRLAELEDQPPSCGAEDVAEIDHAIRERVHRDAEKQVGPDRRQVHLDPARRQWRLGEHVRVMNAGDEDRAICCPIGALSRIHDADRIAEPDDEHHIRMRHLHPSAGWDKLVVTLIARDVRAQMRRRLAREHFPDAGIARRLNGSQLLLPAAFRPRTDVTRPGVRVRAFWKAARASSR